MGHLFGYITWSSHAVPAPSLTTSRLLYGFLLAGGAALRKASRLRVLAAGWMTAGIAAALVMAGLCLAHWTGLL